MTTLDGHSIICMANDWASDPLSKKHIMRILARNNRVLWINSIGMRRPTASRADVRRLLAKLRAGGECAEAEPNIFVAAPLVLPLVGMRMADALNAAILTGWLRHLCRRYAMERPIFWTFFPNVNRLVGRLGERMVVYHCVDEYSELPGMPQQALIRMEQDLVRRADVVITSAEKLRDDRRAINPNTHFVAHGVDVEHFARALCPTTAVPEELRTIGHPVIGFFGLLAEWVDVELVRQVALMRPHWSIVLIGKAVADLTPVRDLPNVRILGQKPYEALPGYCRGIDVAIIPFRMNTLTLRCNPLKMREYLAAGLPVVSTPLPEVKRYAGLVHLAEGATAFAAAIDTALDERSDALAHRRLQAMRAESWDARVAEMTSLVADRLSSC